MPAPPAKQILAGSCSCSPVTSGQIAWAMKHGFAEVPLNTTALISDRKGEVQRAVDSAAKHLNAGRSVIVHTTRKGSDQRVAVKLQKDTAPVLGTALGEMLLGALGRTRVGRLCIAGGDTSSYAARALGIEALEMVATLTPGAPLCRAASKYAAVDGLEVVFKGGQVGGENYFGVVRKGKA